MQHQYQGEGGQEIGEQFQRTASSSRPSRVTSTLIMDTTGSQSFAIPRQYLPNIKDIGLIKLIGVFTSGFIQRTYISEPIKSAIFIYLLVRFLLVSKDLSTYLYIPQISASVSMGVSEIFDFYFNRNLSLGIVDHLYLFFS